MTRATVAPNNGKHIKVTVQGVGGVTTATIPYPEWCAMSPVARVLALYDACRDTLQGRPFTVLGEAILGEAIQ